MKKKIGVYPTFCVSDRILFRNESTKNKCGIRIKREGYT